MPRLAEGESGLAASKRLLNQYSSAARGNPLYCKREKVMQPAQICCRARVCLVVRQAAKGLVIRRAICDQRETSSPMNLDRPDVNCCALYAQGDEGVSTTTTV